MRIARLCLALSFLLLAPAGTAFALQPGPGSYRVDWPRAAFEGPMWLVQCTGPCPGDGLALVGNPNTFPAGSLRVLGGPYRHGTDLMLDRHRLLAAGLPARPLRVDVRDSRGQPLDGLLLADPAELGRLTASLSVSRGSAAATASAATASDVTTTVCRFTHGPRAGRTVDLAGRPRVSPIAVGRRCADADGSMGIAVASVTSPH